MRLATSARSPVRALVLGVVPLLILGAAACGGGDNKDSGGDGPLGGVVDLGSLDLHDAVPGQVVSEVGTVSTRSYLTKRLLVATTKSDGSPTVTGVLLYEPEVPNGTAVIYGHPTIDPPDLCAPSINPPDPLLTQLVNEGVTVAAVDYPGLGTTGRETYLVASSLGRSLLDVALFISRKYSPQEMWVTGFSEGGLAALAASALQSGYSPDLKVDGYAVGAPWVDAYKFVSGYVSGPADINIEMLALLVRPDPLVVRAAAGLAEAYGKDPTALLDSQSLDWLAHAETDKCETATGAAPRVRLSRTQQSTFKTLTDQERALVGRPSGAVWLVSAANDDFFGAAAAKGFADAQCTNPLLRLWSAVVPGGHAEASEAFRDAVVHLAVDGDARPALFVNPCVATG